MFQFGEKHPVLMEIILFVVSLFVAAMFIVAGNILNLHEALSNSVARIIAGVLLYFGYRRAFVGNRLFGNPVYVVPALLFAIWNVFYNLSSGMQFGGMAYYVEAFVTALAPAIYEEVLFRGIFLYNLKKKGHDALGCVLISAAVFSAVHATNIVGIPVADVALQVGYSFVIGMVFGAIYLKNNSLLEVVIAHFLIDFTNRIYTEKATSVSTVQLVIFVALLVGEAVWAIWATKRNE